MNHEPQVIPFDRHVCYQIFESRKEFEEVLNRSKLRGGGVSLL